MKVKFFIVNLLLLVCVFTYNCIYGVASLSVKSEGYVGDVVTVTATVSNVAAWNMSITASGNVSYVSGVLKSSDVTSNAENGSKTITANYKLTGKGNGTFKLHADTVTSDKKEDSVNVVKNITIKEKEVAPPPKPKPQPENKPKPENKPVSKSSNNYLKSMYLNVDGLNPRFSSTRMNYSLTVNENISSINVNARVADPKAKFYVSGNRNLKVGENKIYIVVTAENGYKRTYTINVTKTSNPNDSNAFLDNLVVEGYNLNPLFTFDNFEYNLGNIKNIDKLKILAYPKIDGVNIEIVNNEDLKVGENKVVVKVTSKDKTITKEYVIKFNNLEKELVKEDEVKIYDNDVDIYEEKNRYVNVNNNFKDIKLFFKYNGLKILLLSLCIVELVEIIYLYNKVRIYEKSNESEVISSRRRNNNQDDK